MFFDVSKYSLFKEEAEEPAAEEGSSIAAEVVELLNAQIVNEFYSAYLYLDMANYYRDIALDGFANYFEVQAHEEMDHGMMFRKYLIDNNIKVVFDAIKKPDKVYDDLHQPLEAALEHEKLVTGMINTIYEAAHKTNDFKTMEFLDWFVKEQVEEEKTADDLIKRANLFSHGSNGLFGLDKELSERKYEPIQ